ncbi:putative DnaG-like primase [uncultured Caudovirales phage]|uniref:Putative DnaG-like primase n=1 Tax=uncultured Caudovirales phage TaxID=2100421 RepID=A0A6J5T905_9CAUD|nr:putative DnaG-like primase [uncultured Caudovirales phage]
MAYFLYHTACGDCGSRDNLGHYSDGSTYCFGCGASTATTNIRGKLNKEKKQDKLVQLPNDFSLDVPQKFIDWLSKYGNYSDYQRYVGYSEFYDRAIFPYKTKQGLLFGWQGRSLEDKNKKWLSIGKLTDNPMVYGNGDKLVLVEDVISAIKISKFTSCMVLFGTNISLNHVKTALEAKKQVVIWLDKDKRNKSIRDASRLRGFGLSVGVVFSEKDPKELTNSEIVKKLWTN